jgi:hypothetical protein
MRGRRPIPTAIHLLKGSFRWDRHGRRIDAPPRDGRTALLSRQPAAEPDPEAERRQQEMLDWLRRIKGG